MKWSALREEMKWKMCTAAKTMSRSIMSLFIYSQMSLKANVVLCWLASAHRVHTVCYSMADK